MTEHQKPPILESKLATKRKNLILFEYLAEQWKRIKCERIETNPKNEIYEKELAICDRLLDFLFFNLFEEHYHMKILNNLLLEYSKIKREKIAYFAWLSVLEEAIKTFYTFYTIQTEQVLLTKIHLNYILKNRSLSEYDKKVIQNLLTDFSQLIETIKFLRFRYAGKSEENYCVVSWKNDTGLIKYKLRFDLYSDSLFSKFGFIHFDNSQDAESMTLDAIFEHLPLDAKKMSIFSDSMINHKKKVIYSNESIAFEVPIFDVLKISQDDIRDLVRYDLAIDKEKNLISGSVCTDTNSGLHQRYIYTKTEFIIDASTLQIIKMESESESYK